MKPFSITTFPPLSPELCKRLHFHRFVELFFRLPLVFCLPRADKSWYLWGAQIEFRRTKILELYSWEPLIVESLSQSVRLVFIIVSFRGNCGNVTFDNFAVRCGCEPDDRANSAVELFVIRKTSGHKRKEFFLCVSAKAFLFLVTTAGRKVQRGFDTLTIATVPTPPINSITFSISDGLM
jgi:hypothetical protein